jgi:mono/diheme cytochrome c family protein
MTPFSLGSRLRIITSMHKLLLNVAAILVFVALVILAQAPDAAPVAKAPTGPDAVAANLVNTVCASCHTLDRVKNKMGDKDPWTTTVTRMQGKGADLTDAQVPVVVEYLTRAASTLTVAAADGKGGKGGGKGGKGGGKGPVAPFSAGGAAIVSASNLKVLTAQNVEITMQNITFALGVGCIYCHDLNDLSLDTKPKKLKARMMLEMVRDINAKFGDGNTHVTCWTCHRASTEPQIAKPATN